MLLHALARLERSNGSCRAHYPDVIESISFKGPSATIKTHHNVGGLPKRMTEGQGLKPIESLRELFKDQVRELGRQLGLAHDLVCRYETNMEQLLSGRRPRSWLPDAAAGSWSNSLLPVARASGAAPAGRQERRGCCGLR